MFRFALAYQGSGGGSVTYLAGGTEIDVTLNNVDIDIEIAASIDLSTNGLDIDTMSAPYLVDIEDGRTEIDISG